MKTNQIKAGAILNYVQLFVGVIISLSIHQTIINKILPMINIAKHNGVKTVRKHVFCIFYQG